MAIFRIPFGIDNERRYVSLAFEDNKESNYSFVVKDEGVGVIPLLFFLKDMRATSLHSKTYDENVKLQSFCYDKDQNLFILTLSDKKETKEDSIKQENLSIVKSDNNCWKLMREAGKIPEKLDVTVKLIIKDMEFISNLHFAIFPKEFYYVLSLDFGSEASQMSIVYADSGVERFKLFKRAREIYYDNDSKLRDNEFNQYSSDDQCLFNSVFFRNIDDKELAFITATKDTVDIAKDKRKYDIIPNLKMSLLHNQRNNYVDVVLGFIKTAIAEILKVREEERKEPLKTMGLFLNLLVPNVMKMEQIENLINDVSDAFSKDKGFEDFFLEIFPISESDASFIGYDNSTNDYHIIPDEGYLTIDGGKGTMDFSLIRKINGTRYSYECLFRDGFVGSGNAITYALFDHVCAIMVGPTDVEKRKGLMAKILFESDPYGLLQLAKQLDSIKKNYNVEDIDKAEKCCQLLKDRTVGKTDELVASGLANILQEIGKEISNPYFGDKFGIIHATCYNICNLMVSNLIRSRIYPKQLKSKMESEPEYNESSSLFYHHVLLSGRAFKFTPLREQLKHVLMEDFGMNNNDIVYKEETAKSGCLNGTLRNLVVNLNCGLFGKPVVVKALNESEKKKKHLNNNVFNWLSNSEHGIEKDVKFDDKDVDVVSLMNGWDFDLGVQDNVRLNGHKLDVVRNRSCDFNMYFANATLYLRDKENVSPLTYMNDIVTQTETNMSYMSRFPDYQNGNIDEDKRNLYAWSLPDVKQLLND